MSRDSQESPEGCPCSIQFSSSLVKYSPVQPSKVKLAWTYRGAHVCVMTQRSLAISVYSHLALTTSIV